MYRAKELVTLLSGFAGQYIPAGPSGLITRGRDDVLPTGRFVMAKFKRISHGFVWSKFLRDVYRCAVVNQLEAVERNQESGFSCAKKTNRKEGAKPGLLAASQKTTVSKVSPFAIEFAVAAQYMR